MVLSILIVIVIVIVIVIASALNAGLAHLLWPSCRF